MLKLIRIMVLAVAAIVLLSISACSTSPVLTAPATSTAPTDSAYATTANDVLFNALSLVGTPYRYGGSNPATGFDCSGLIAYVYRESAELQLPRTVAAMNALAVPTIAAENLQTGDLLIFATGAGARPSHAGIYVGDGRFVHAPSGGGVVRMDYLSDRYWQRSYLSAKRLLVTR